MDRKSELLDICSQTISRLAAELNQTSSEEYICHICSHFPMGGDGQCGLQEGEGCNFMWRYQPYIEDILKKEELK